MQCKLRCAYGVTISLVGKPDVIRAELAKFATNGLNFPIVAASEVIGMEEKPAAAVRAKPDSSMVVACRMVRSGEAQAFVTAGNTGAALAAGILQIGRIKGILRPALLTHFPTSKGACVVLDVGANTDVRAEHLQQFAIMGSIYACQVLSIPEPRVCLLSNGEEAGKGNQLVLAAFPLLEHTPGINFQGNTESKDVVAGLVDVVVTDGFSGNVFIKTAEATASMLQQIIFEELTSGPVSSVGALLAKPALRRVRSRMDDSQYGAALLGLSGLVVKAHGRSRAAGVQSAIRFAKQGLEHHILDEIRAGIELLEAAAAQREDAGALHTNIST